MFHLEISMCLNICFSFLQEVMKSFKLEILPLPNEELPNFKTEDKLTVALLIYRDTLNYLDYLAQVFQKMYDSKVTPKA